MMSDIACTFENCFVIMRKEAYPAIPESKLPSNVDGVVRGDQNSPSFLNSMLRLRAKRSE